MSSKVRAQRHEMPKQAPDKRIKNFSEVTLGYTPELAVAEASRCIGCPKKPCVSGCPVGVDIPEFIALIAEGDFLGAAKKIKEKNSLPAMCGRVCPQESQCEAVCTLGKKGNPVAIGALERFAADFERLHADPLAEAQSSDLSMGKVAVVGSGPAGLTCAAELTKLGYKVVLFESLHATGGVLRYGIPEFRLPKDIVDEEVEYVKRQGVEIRLNVLVGTTVTLDELFAQGFDAIFLGTGAGLPYFLGVPGENLNGVYSANEFLTRTNLMKAYQFPEYDTPVSVGKRVVVVGGGNVAMDSARCALRLGAEKVAVVYRRSRTEMPARLEEVENAEEEGIEFMFLSNPVRILEDDKGWVKGMECIRMELGDADDSGRRRPVPVPGSEFILDVDTVISAVGTNPNPLLIRTVSGLALGRRGNVIADDETGMTNIPGVFAGGDIVTGSATVIAAMGAGKLAAHGIDEYVRTKNGRGM
ncbi:MAG TPA: NADPH-dependent glutamate synthase [Bacillota bacterium]|nr:NADPH-dependent glutamate synthase [Bacillota bacterium]